jgi:hypothetical protein
MGEDTKGLGNKIKCMAKGFTPGKMEENMMEIIYMIKNK